MFGAAGAAFVRNEFTDVSTCAYLWTGVCGPVPQTPGELGEATDATQDTLSVYLRSSLEVRVADSHTLRLSVAPTYTELGGRERFRQQGGTSVGQLGNAVEAERDLLTTVVGLEYELSAFDERLRTVIFGKWYGLRGEAESFNVLDEEVVDLSTNDFGGGTVVRYRLSGPMHVEASYELAYRIPTPVEFFGVPGQILPNLELLPEQGHNANLGLRLTPWTTQIGVLRSEVNGFFRDTNDLIRLENFLSFLAFNNVSSARSLGVETSLGWTSPGQYVSLEGSFTYMDYRNTSTSGRDAAFKGDRIPNTPYIFGGVTARFRLSDAFMDRDQIELSWSSRVVHGFFLSFESAGRSDTKDRVDTQVESSLNLAYRFRAFDQSVAAAFDIQNITDEALFDFFGIQRPQRAFFFRVAVDLEPWPRS